MIDSLADKHMLYDLGKDIFPYVINYRTKKIDKADNNLSEAQIIELDETISNADTDGSTLKEVEKSFAKWLPGDSKQNIRTEKKISATSKKKLKKKLHRLVEDIDSKYVLKVLLNDIMPDALNTPLYG